VTPTSPRTRAANAAANRRGKSTTLNIAARAGHAVLTGATWKPCASAAIAS
jgi:hypothetical protein